MFPFKRKIEDEELDDVKPVKKVRKRKKKASPPKPWGKVERLIVFTFLVFIPTLSLVFFAHSKNPSTPKVLGDLTIRAPKDINLLKEQLSNEIKNKKGTYGIWVQALDNSYSLGIHEN